MVSIGKISVFQKFALGAGAGLIAASIAIAVLFPSNGATRAPKAIMELQASVSVTPVPVSSVEVEVLPFMKPALSGLSVAQARLSLAYDLDLISSAGVAVPRVFLSTIPHDLGDVRETDLRKALFFKSVLPLVLQVNEEIQLQRARLERINDKILQGQKPRASERLWLAMMSERFKVERDDVAALLLKVDVVPPSLALAQAAKESGWGLSRFAQEGNALFGQWTFDEGNLVPDARDTDKSHMIRSFDTLIDSVRAYVHNLNTHRAYREYRKLRADLRIENKPLDGRVLAGKLHRYSELGVEYVNAIRTMISYNKLSRLDDARLNLDQSEV